MSGPSIASSAIHSHRPLGAEHDQAPPISGSPQECSSDLARTMDSVAPWFCETKREAANTLMQELHARNDSTSNFDLIEKFYALKNLAGADYQANFQRSNTHDRFAYFITLDDAENKIVHFEVEFQPTKPPSAKPVQTNPLNMCLAAGSVAAGLCAIAYYRPDVKEAGLHLLSRTASAAWRGAYDIALEWKDFALTIDYPQKAANVLNLAAKRADSGADSLRAGALCIQDSSCVYGVAANCFAYARNKALEIFWGQVSFTIVGAVWGKISPMLMPPAPSTALSSVPVAPPAPQSTTRWLVNMAGITYTYSAVFYVYGFFWEALTEPATAAVSA